MIRLLLPAAAWPYGLVVANTHASPGAMAVLIGAPIAAYLIGSVSR